MGFLWGLTAPEATSRARVDYAIRIALVSDETIDEVPVTDAQIQAWSAEAERGYPVESLRRMGRLPIGMQPAPR